MKDRRGQIKFATLVCLQNEGGDEALGDARNKERSVWLWHIVSRTRGSRPLLLPIAACDAYVSMMHAPAGNELLHELRETRIGVDGSTIIGSFDHCGCRSQG